VVNAKENILPVCDKHYHTNKINTQKWGIEVLRDYALFRIGGMIHYLAARALFNYLRIQSDKQI